MNRPERRWRPLDRRGPVCGYTFDGARCRKRGAHYCKPRADRAVAFFEELLVHTKGRWARQAFELDEWQEQEIVRPIFGEVQWSTEWGCYVRRYRVVWIELARKNGKSELAAGIVLILLVGDDEESAEVYGAAKDTKQAGKVWEPARRMTQLSPVLNKRLGVNQHSRRLFDERTASYYEVITADAAGELGHNPHGVVIDEVLAQASGDLWDALRTGMGARHQPLMIGLTTAGTDQSGFAKAQHDEMLRVLEDPARAPHIFVYLRNTPMDADPFDERNWFHANPALGRFLSIEELRAEALEAKNEPTKENAFRQFRLNQWVSQVSRWMPMHIYDASAGMVVEEQLVGRPCYGGLDLSAVSDLTSLCWLFPAGDDRCDVIWRHFAPEAAVPFLDQHTAGRFSLWARQGFVTITEGDVIDYDVLHSTILHDAKRYAPVTLGIDRWNSVSTTNWLEKELPRVTPLLVGQGFAGISSSMKEVMRLVRIRGLVHGGNPVARYCFDSVEVRQDDAENIKPVKPRRSMSGRRIDAVASLANAVDGWMRAEPQPQTYVPRRIR